MIMLNGCLSDYDVLHHSLSKVQDTVGVLAPNSLEASVLESFSFSSVSTPCSKNQTHTPYFLTMIHTEPHHCGCVYYVSQYLSCSLMDDVLLLHDSLFVKGRTTMGNQTSSFLSLYFYSLVPPPV